MSRRITGRRAVTVLAAAIAVLLLTGTMVIANHGFSDVPNSAFYHADVDWALDNGVTAGCGGGKYCPNSAVTRGQLATFLNETAGVTASAGFHLVGGVIAEYFNHVSRVAPVPSCTADSCDVNVGFPTGDRFVNCTIDTNAVATRDAICTASRPSGNIVRVRAWDISAAAFVSDTADFWVLVFGNAA